jgi:hypothetical protein
MCTVVINCIEAGDSSTSEGEGNCLRGSSHRAQGNTQSYRDVLTPVNVLDVYELSGKYLLIDLEKHCVWYMQSSSNLECTSQCHILCKCKAG